MAIVFVSPEKKQKKFFLVIAFSSLFIILVASFIFVFLPEIKERFASLNLDMEESVEIPELKIDFAAIQSDKIKNLEPFLVIGTEFLYTASDKDNKEVQGKVSATNAEEAVQILEKMGLKVTDLQEVKAGKEEPFSSY